MITASIPAATTDEAVWKPHVTVAAIVCRDRRFLLVEEDVGGEILFNQPAGHLELGETLTAAVCRETLEETGWTVEPEALVAVHQWSHPRNGRAILRFSFAARAVGHDPRLPLDSGILSTHWLGRDEIAAYGPRLRSPMILASIDAWLGGRRWPLDVLKALPGTGG